MSGTRTFPKNWPTKCPPADAKDADVVVYRTVRTDPPTNEDFLSWHEEGKEPKYPGKECQACSVSVHRTQESAIHHREVCEYDGACIAVGVLNPSHGKTKDTPTRKFPLHVSWWPYEGIDRGAIFKVMPGA